jgi:hypothetical protein
MKNLGIVFRSQRGEAATKIGISPAKLAKDAKEKRYISELGVLGALGARNIRI